MVAEGDRAPDFTLPDQDGNDVSLAGLRGQTVVLYFYPKADTPGCTKQACGVRDRSAEYDASGARVIGESLDPVDEVKRFADKYSLDFTLLADADHSVCEAYGSGSRRRTTGGRTGPPSARPSSSTARASCAT